MKYSEERREAILRKLLPPENRPVAEVAAQDDDASPGGLQTGKRHQRGGHADHEQLAATRLRGIERSQGYE